MPPVPDEDDLLAQMLARSRLLEDAPDTLITAAIGLWRDRPVSAAAPRPALLELVARLVFDSAGQPATALGLRGDEMPVRQLLYSLSGRDVDLRIAAQPDGRLQVSGQVLGPDEAGLAELVGPDGIVLQTAWGEDGEFRFEPFERRAAGLRLRTATWQVLLPLDLPTP